MTRNDTLLAELKGTLQPDTSLGPSNNIQITGAGVHSAALISGVWGRVCVFITRAGLARGEWGREGQVVGQGVIRRREPSSAAGLW